MTLDLPFPPESPSSLGPKAPTSPSFQATQQTELVGGMRCGPSRTLPAFHSLPVPPPILTEA